MVAPAPPLFAAADDIGDLTRTYQATTSDAEYWLVADGRTQTPLVLINNVDSTTPAAIVIPLSPDFLARADAALRFWHLSRGHASRSSPVSLTPHQRLRYPLTLRALDAHLAGEPYRPIAQGLFGAARVPSGRAWKTHDLRDRTIRLVRAGLALMRGGYRDLLRLSRRRNNR